MRTYDKKNFPVAKIRRFLEPGPIVLVTSAHKGERNIMTLGWHMVMGFEPSLVGCYVWDENHSFSLIRRSKECVINVPTFDLVNAVIGVGNSHGPGVDKFEQFGLTAVEASKVDAPLIAECHASFECWLYRLIRLVSTSRHSKLAWHSAMSGASTFDASTAVRPNCSNLSTPGPWLFPTPMTAFTRSNVGTLITHSLLRRISEKLWFSSQT